MSTPACSVVIPSHDRPAMLGLMLAALAAQDTQESIEVIVVLDGPTDASRDVLEQWEDLPVITLRWIEQARQGQAIARNNGSFLARAPILLFLDDDCIPEPDLVRRHLAHYASGERIAVLGDCEIARNDDRSLSQLDMWMWWEDTNYRRAAAWQPQSYRDFCTGNVSLRREDFARVGGFDQDFTGYGREDYELGYRLLQSGVRFVADRRVRARHHNTASVQERSASARQEAHGDLLIARKHPELTAGLRFMSDGSRRTKVLRWLAMRAPWLGMALCFLARGVVTVCEPLRLRRRWRSGVGFIWEFSYWRGIRDVVGSTEGLRAVQRTAARPVTQHVDLAEPLPPQVTRLEIDVPSTLEIWLDGKAIGRLDLRPSQSAPMLEWLTREIAAHLAPEVLAELGRRALEQGGVRSGMDTWFLPAI
jgi:GT2 family glycosyltransferase